MKIIELLSLKSVCGYDGLVRFFFFNDLHRHRFTVFDLFLAHSPQFTFWNASYDVVP